MSHIRIGDHETLVTPLILGDGDSLTIARGGTLHVGGRQSAVVLFGGTSEVRNAGVIESDDGSAITGRLSGSVALLIRNDGSIVGGSFGIALGSDDATAGALKVHNSGSISATGYAAIDFSILHVDRTVFVNAGSLNTSQPGSTSAPLAYAGSDGDDVVLNHGSIGGTVSLGGGNDVFRDTSSSGRPLSMILGGEGDDRIFGGGGTDLILGGAGRDVMCGNAGSDIFAYTDVAESGTEIGRADRIRGFNVAGGEVIDLSRIDADESRTGDQAFSLIGTSAFSGHAGELRCDLRPGGAIVYADVDGDAVPDFTLVVRGDIRVPADLHFML